MANGWEKKGKYLYEHSITKSWLGIKKRKYIKSPITQIDDFDRFNNKWIKGTRIWSLIVKDSRGDIEFADSTITQSEIFKKAIAYMKTYPSKIVQHNFMFNP